jgi:hypothetical protein
MNWSMHMFPESSRQMRLMILDLIQSSHQPNIKHTINIYGPNEMWKFTISTMVSKGMFNIRGKGLVPLRPEGIT